MLKNLFRFLSLIILNYLLILLSIDIDLDQLVKDFKVFGFIVNSDNYTVHIFVCFLITFLNLF